MTVRSIHLRLLCCLLVCSAAVSGVLGQNSTADADHPAASYRINPGDKLNIKFFANSELNESGILVRPDGVINPQLIGEVKAAGRTVSELKAQLEKEYNEILLSPMITVSIVDLVQPRVFVGGQINKPGRYELREAKTLMQSIFLAGGFTRDARRTMVIHARPDGKGDWIITTADVMKLIEGKSDKLDVSLRDGDYVFVPDSRISQFNKAVEAFRGLMPRFF